MLRRREKSPEGCGDGLSKNENGFAVNRAVVDLSECLNRIVQGKASDDGSGLERARFEARRELLQDGRAGHDIEAARVYAEQAESAVVEIEQVEADSAIPYRGDVDLAAELAEGA